MKKPSTVLTRPDSYVKNGMNDCRHLYNRQETTRKDTAKHALKRCGSANKPAILREKTEEAYEGSRMSLPTQMAIGMVLGIAPGH